MAPRSAARVKVREKKQPFMSANDFARLGGGSIAYITSMPSEEAQKMFPAIEGLPTGITLFCLVAADGTPIALTDSKQAAIGHAKGDKLEVKSIH